MTADFDALARTLDSRWTCRSFLPDQVPPETMERLLGTAQRTPSWCNTQPWQIVVTGGASTDRFRKALVEHVESGAIPEPDIAFPTRYAGAYQQRRRECGMQLYQAVGVPKEDMAGRARQMLRNFELFDAPHVAIVHTEAELGTYGAVDCGLWIDSFLLGAQALGLGAAPQAALATYSPFVRSYFDIPDTRLVVAGISFGYPDQDAAVNTFRTTRVDLGDVVDWQLD